MKRMRYLSLTLEQGSIDSSLAATRATQPSVILFKYTKGVLPINYNTRKLCLAHNKIDKNENTINICCSNKKNTAINLQITYFSNILSYSNISLSHISRLSCKPITKSCRKHAQKSEIMLLQRSSSS